MSLTLDRAFYSIAAAFIAILTFIGFLPFYLRGQGMVDRTISPALLPLVGVGSHIPFGCGVGEVTPFEAGKLASPPSAEGNVRKLVLQWRSGIA